VWADRFRDGVSVAAGSDDAVTSAQRSLGKLDAQAAAAPVMNQVLGVVMAPS
jgi:hypothetical protein